MLHKLCEKVFKFQIFFSTILTEFLLYSLKIEMRVDGLLT
jgi:hypothetical protein